MVKPKKNRAAGNKNNNNSRSAAKTKKPREKRFKFDVKKILKKRQAEKERLQAKKECESDDEQSKIIDELFQAEVNERIARENPIVQKPDRISFDCSKYNIPFNDDPNCTVSESCAKRFSIMSDEANEMMAYIHFSHLMKADWSIKFEDVQTIINNWVADIDTFTNKQWSKCKLNSDKIGKHNFELVSRFIWTCIMRNNHQFSENDLLTLASFAVILSFDPQCGQMINVAQKLFKTCIEKSLLKDDETDFIGFAQELYSQYNEDDISRLIVYLFLPLESDTPKKMYTYLTFKLFNSLLGKNNNNVFPNDTTDWFVQDLVNHDYFKEKPNILFKVIKLLEHVVLVFNLYEHEKKLKEMYNFFSFLLKSVDVTESLVYINILDQWKFRLTRLRFLRYNDM